MSNLPFDSYIICTSPRSGSTLLCGLLEATGKAGLPDSHFHVPSIDRWLKTYGLNKGDYASERDAVQAVFDAARQAGTGDTGLFGLRLQQHSFDYFMRQAGVLFPECRSDRERIEAAFGRTLYIHLTRPNKLDQAISRVKAGQSGLWHRAADGSELERLSPHRDPFYDAEEIERHLNDLTEMDAAWARWFKKQTLNPLRITYESLSANPAGVLAKVLGALGLDPKRAEGIEPPVAKLADSTSRKWADRYIVEKAKDR